jgi:Domain of unknown function (DUF6916)
MTIVTCRVDQQEVKGNREAPDLTLMTHMDFAPHLEQIFMIQQGQLSVEATLVSVTPWGKPRNDARQAFTLLFRGAVVPVLPQQIYTVENPELGRMEIFLVPIGPNGVGMQYEAVFS